MIYLDNAATSWPKPDSVYEAVDRWQRTVGVGPSRGDSSRTGEVARAVARARSEIADLLGGNAKHTIFALNATDAMNMLLKGLLVAGDHVVTSQAEHNAVVRPLRALSTAGVGFGPPISTTFTPVDASGRASVDAVRGALTPATRMVVLCHASNVTGAIQPIAEVAVLCRDAGIPLFLDAAQTAGVLPIDMAALDVDGVVASGHKGLLGPQGTGVLCLRSELPIRPLREGGTGSSTALDVQPTDWPTRLEAGTPNTGGILGLLAGVQFVRERGVATIHRHGLDMLQTLVEALAPAIDSRRIRIVGPGMSDPARVAVLSLVAPGLSPAEIGLALDAADIAVRSGYHCAPYVHDALGTADGGTVRLSPGPFTTPDEMETAAAVLADLVG